MVLTNLHPKSGRHTMEEILSQPEVWRRCLDLLESDGNLQQLANDLPLKIEWVFVGCGSSFYLAQVAAATWSLVTGEIGRAVPASEILLFPALLPRPCQPVLISRSGRTSEMVEVASYLENEQSIRTLGLTCSVDAPMQTICTHLIQLSPADEQSTVMTRSFTSMLLALQALAAHRAGRRDLLDALQATAADVGKRLDDWQATIQSVVDSREFADYVFLGQGPWFGVAQEAMLKVKEMSCSYAQAFHTLEFRHGPKAIVGPEVPLTFFMSETGMEEETAVLEEMKELGGTTLVVTNSASSAVRQAADYLIELDLTVPETARTLAAVIPGQLLGLYNGLRKGLNPDHPRNLTRVVMLDSRGGPDRGEA
ncbi:MAG TPA: SIS domain-containing protein [Terriglobales bacterium]|nr:SIS domain-containing protein [Terriglobales bacterium]